MFRESSGSLHLDKMVYDYIVKIKIICEGGAYRGETDFLFRCREVRGMMFED